MNKAIGFRAEPKSVHWAVVEGSSTEPILVDRGTITSPKTYGEPQSLTWFRARAQELLARFGPESGGIKYTEQLARGGGDSMRTRCRIEGVILQLLDQERIEILTGNFRRVSGQMGSASAKKYLDSDDLRGLDWKALPRIQREAVLVAVAALKE